MAAAVAIQIARLVADFPDEEPTWFARNLSLFVLPFLAGYFARRRQLDPQQWALAAAPFALAALVVNLYPWDADSSTEELVAIHLPVVLWFASPTRTWAARSSRTSGAWTSSASRASGSSTTC